MKIGPKFLSKKYMMKELNSRNLDRINDYTRVSEELSEKQKQLLNESIDSISRYAQKKGAILEFVPAEDLFQNQVQMNVYKKGISVLSGNDSLPVMVFDSKSLSGQTILHDDVKQPFDLILEIRAAVKNIIDRDSNWQNKLHNIFPW